MDETFLHHSENLISNNQIQNHEINEIKNANQSENNSNEYILKPRCETIIKIKVINSNINEGICPDVPILDGVYLCPSIVRIDKTKHAITSILNTTEKEVKIKNIEIYLDDISFSDNKNIMQISKNNNSVDSDSSRLSKITNLLRTDHLNQEEKSSLISICHEYNNIFHLEGDKLTTTDAIMHEIHTTPCSPINTKSYRYPQIHKEEVDRQISKMLDENIISHSISPWNSPVWIVPKKQDASGKKKWRIVIDYRKLNDVTVGDSFPLPNISDILDQLGHSKYFSTIDLTSGFHQIKMSPTDAEKTAFSTPSGHYQFNRMPFGLKNAPATFQRLMNSVLAGLQNIKCFVYLDDIVVHADTLENHNKRLIEVFQRLSSFNLKIQPDKCEFLRKEVMYLGHLITNKGVKPDPNKVKAVLEFPTPQNPKDIKSFLGLAGYYRRFIENFSKITLPLTKLLKKDAIFLWTSDQQNAFEKLKNTLCTEPLLQYPDFTQTFYLTTDASNYAIGSVLSQNKPPNDLPIAYASRTLNHAESNYSTTERELLSIVWSVKHFRPYLYGRQFIILTDHKPLTWLFNVKDPGSRLVRWRLILEEYDYKIEYKPGKTNQNADCLSRPPLTTDHKLLPNTIDNTEILPNTSLSNVNHTQSKPINTFKDFNEKLLTTVITNNNIEEISNKISDCQNNTCIFYSCDLQITEPSQEEINKKFNHIEKLKKLNPNQLDLITIKQDNFSIFYGFINKHYWESISYEDLFNILIKLKNKLLETNQQIIFMPRIQFSYSKLNWNKIRAMLRYIFKNTNITVKICHDILKTPKDSDIPIILHENHTNPTSGHSGFHRTYNRIKQTYHWSNMKSDIKNFIKSCESCQKNKLVRNKTVKPMEITTTSSNPLEKIFLDIVGPLPLTEKGNKYILTLQDDLTKFSQAYAIPNHEAITIAKNFANNFICKFGIPKCIVTDQGKDFTSKLLNQVAKYFKIKQINCTTYHPQSNGALERSHATLADYLKHYINQDQTNWDDWIDHAMFSYNTTPHTSTKFSPHELIFGTKPNIPSSITKEPEFKYTYDDYLDILKMRMQKSHEIAKNNAIESKITNKKYYDRKVNNVEFQAGDLVFLLNEKTKPGKSKKLTPHYEGPYKIIEVNSPVNCTLQIKNKKSKVHVNKLKQAFVSDV